MKQGAIIIEGHVQGLSNTRSLGESGIPVMVVDTANCLARYSKYCLKFFKCPPFLSDEFPAFLIDLAKSEHLINWVLLPSNDHAVYSMAKHARELAEYFQFFNQDLSQLEKIYDKLNLLKFAQENNLPCPEIWHFETLDDIPNHNIKFPVIIKGRFGFSFYKTFGKKVFYAKNQEELKTHLKQISGLFPIKNTFTQVLIPNTIHNKTISFTSFCIEGEIKTHFAGSKQREHPLEFGTATYAESADCQDCYESSKALLSALRYTGVCEIEYLFNEQTNQYELIEINARTWLWVGLAKACGIDYANIIFKYFNNIAIVYPDQYATGVSWINILTDTIYSGLAILKRRLTLKQYLSSMIRRKKVHAVFSSRDIMPSFFSPMIFVGRLFKTNQ